MKITLTTDAHNVVKYVCEALEVKESDVLSMTRKREAVDARYLIVSFLKAKFEGTHSLTTIGSWFSRSHSFVIVACNQVESLRKTNSAFREKYDKCSAYFFDLSIYNHIPQY